MKPGKSRQGLEDAHKRGKERKGSKKKQKKEGRQDRIRRREGGKRIEGRFGNSRRWQPGRGLAGVGPTNQEA